MTPNHLIRLTKPLLLAAIAAALAVPAVALAGANSGYGPHDGWYGYAISVTQSDRAASDSNRYGPRDGWYTYATSLTKSDRDAASDSNRYGPRDGWYSHAVSLTTAKALTVDGRSPDTLDAARSVQTQVAQSQPSPVERIIRQEEARRNDSRLAIGPRQQPLRTIKVVPGGFDWGDAAIGAAVGAALIGLLGSSLLMVQGHRRQRVRTT